MKHDDDRERFRQRLESHHDRHFETLDVSWTNDAPWDALPIRVVFDRSPNDRDVKEIEDFVVGWHRVGVAGGFEGVVHDANIKGLRREGEEQVFEVVLDVGSAPQLAIDVFLRGLRGMKAWNIPIGRVIVGWQESEG